MAKQFGNCWLARDNGGGSHYCLSVHRPKYENRGDTNIFWECQGQQDYVSPAIFHKRFPVVRLKPGEGPVRALIMLEVE